MVIKIALPPPTPTPTRHSEVITIQWVLARPRAIGVGKSLFVSHSAFWTPNLNKVNIKIRNEDKTWLLLTDPTGQ
jgi:hypothetical protein